MSLIAVLIPLLFMADVVGRLFREFAITLAVSILISLVVSLTLTPMMCARLLKHEPPSAMAGCHHATGRFFDGMIARYGRDADWVLRYQTLTLLVAVATLALTVVAVRHRAEGLLPGAGHAARSRWSPRRRSRSRSPRWPSASSAAARAILEEPDVTSLSSFIGVDGIERHAQQRPHARQR